MKGVSLHHHTTFSYGDGYGQPSDHIERCVDLEMSAQGVTEHGNVSSHVPHEKAAVKAGIKPLFGLEAYTAPVSMRQDANTRKWHLTILAQTDEGYRNLMRLTTRSWAEGFYGKPTISGPMLAEHSEGLIVLSGCADSKLACDLLGGKGRDTGDERDAIRTIKQFKRLFGDRYYLECQQFPELERTRTLNAWYAEQSKRLGVPLVGTADVHYPDPMDNEMQVILHTASRGGSTVEVTEANWEYDILLTHPTSDEEWIRRLRGTGLSRSEAEGALDNTAVIAERCNVVLPKVDRLRFPLNEGQTTRDLFWQWLREGWAFRAKRNPRLRTHKAEYVARIKYEAALVEEKDFLDYFLMLSEALRWCKDNVKPVAAGPARGSAAASLVCYLLRITEIDPMPFPNMLFERFIDLNRSDIPDVDLDFDDEQRYRLVEHMVEFWGREFVANIMTVTRYRGKNSLDDVGRVNSVPAWELKIVKDLVVERSSGDSRAGASLEDTFEMFPQAGAVLEKYPVLDKAMRLEGNLKGFSVHAAGLVISNDPLTDNVATYSRIDAKSGNVREVMSVDKYDAEYLNLMKADFLGLSTMGAIGRALDLIGVPLDDLYNIPLDDPEVIDAFRRNDVTGIFQFTGGATRIVCGDVKPDHFGHLCDINALSRPGPLHSGSTADYINIKHGRQEPTHLHPVVDEITQHTLYCIIYQEQILKIVREVGGFDWTHAQEIRKIISQKHGEAAFNMREEMFIDGAQSIHGMSREVAQSIWRRLATAGTYAFNAAHCVSYAMLGYWQMWLKVYHTQAFYASSLIKFPDSQYRLLRDAINHDIKVLPPRIDDLQATWAPYGKDSVQGGLEQVPGIAGKMAEKIMDDRKVNGPFSGWHDLLRVKGIGAAKLATIRGMAESDDPFDIYRIGKVLDKVRKFLASNEAKYAGMPIPTHRGADIPTDAKMLPVTYIGIPVMRNPQDVVEDERARTGETYEVILKRLTRPELTKKMAVECMDDSDRTVYLRFYRQTFPRFEKGLWDAQLNHDVIVIKGKKRGGFGTSVHVSKMWVIDPDLLDD